MAAGSNRGALVLLFVALSTVACRKQQPEQQPAAAQTTPWTEDPAAAAFIPVNSGGATAAPLGAAPSAAPSSAEPPPEPSTLRERAPLNDEQIAAVTSAAHHAELDQAKLAREKATDAELRKFAAQVLKEHEKLDKVQKQLLDKLAPKPAPSSVFDELSSEAASTLATLKKARAVDFDNAYLDTQLRSHQKLLELLKTELVPNAKSVDLRTFLQTSQTRLEAHLEALQKMQSVRTAKGAGGAPATGGGGK